MSSLASHSQSWKLDTLGNWSSQSIDGTATSRTHNGTNELTQVGTSNLTFDNNGNTTTDQAGNTYTYDAWNRLVTVKNSGGTTLGSYAYDAQNRRVQKIAGSTTTHFYLSNQWQVIEERQGSAVTNQYVWSQAYIDGLVLRDDSSTSGNLGISGSGLGRRLYAQQDANWNVTALLSGNGAVQERVAYDPYGNPQPLTSAGANTTDAFSWTYKHQGLMRDGESSLVYGRSRMLHAALGKWMQKDPIGEVAISGTSTALLADKLSADAVQTAALRILHQLGHRQIRDVTA